MVNEKSIVWSILIPTLPVRRNLLERVRSQLEPQLEKYNDIELIILEDNRMRSYGEKMQAMVDLAQGEYLCFVDDDDEVSDFYVDSLYSLMTDSVDCVGITAQISIEGGPWINVQYSSRHKEWVDDPDGIGYLRNPQHLTPIRSDIVRQIPWVGHYGADRDWSTRLTESGLIKTENFNPTPVYFYHAWNSKNREGVWQ